MIGTESDTYRRIVSQNINLMSFLRRVQKYYTITIPKIERENVGKIIFINHTDVTNFTFIDYFINLFLIGNKTVVHFLQEFN